MDVKTFAELFDLHVRGELAKVFLTRGVVPDEKWSEMLAGGKEITLRDIGELSGELNFDPVVILFGKGNVMKHDWVAYELMSLCDGGFSKEYSTGEHRGRRRCGRRLSSVINHTAAELATCIKKSSP